MNNELAKKRVPAMLEHQPTQYQMTRIFYHKLSKKSSKNLI